MISINTGFEADELHDSEPKFEPVEEGNNLILTYYIDEGVQYTYGGISFEDSGFPSARPTS